MTREHKEHVRAMAVLRDCMDSFTRRGGLYRLSPEIAAEKTARRLKLEFKVEYTVEEILDVYHKAGRS